jgi:hypothetical protein
MSRIRFKSNLSGPLVGQYRNIGSTLMGLAVIIVIFIVIGITLFLNSQKIAEEIVKQRIDMLKRLEIYDTAPWVRGMGPTGSMWVMRILGLLLLITGLAGLLWVLFWS